MIMSKALHIESINPLSVNYYACILNICFVQTDSNFILQSYLDFLAMVLNIAICGPFKPDLLPSAKIFCRSFFKTITINSYESKDTLIFLWSGGKSFDSLFLK